MLQKENFEIFTTKVYHQLIDRQRLGAALQLIHSHPQFTLVSGEVAEIEADYQRMCDFMLSGYADEHRQTLYYQLLHRAFAVTQRLALSDWLNHPYLRGYAIIADGINLDVEQMRDDLQQFVQELALLQLENNHDGDEHAKSIYRAHHTLMQRLFITLCFSSQWAHHLGQKIADLLCSPTIEENDGIQLTSAITLGATNVADPEKLLALLHIYRQSTSMRLKQRALVGWMCALMNFPLDFFPEVKDVLNNVLNQTGTPADVSELIIQMMFCLSTDTESKQLHDEMMPHILKVQQDLQDNAFGINIHDEESLDELLHPDKEEKRAEELEKTINHMMDMREKGVDIYFSGFSQMKRFPFFSSLVNWFVPFYIHHPELEQTPQELLNSRFLQTMLTNAPFCDSDKYSMVLGLSQIYGKMPPEFREHFLNADILDQHQNMDISSGTYIRRAYLQDLYRFYHVNDASRDYRMLFNLDGLCRVITLDTFKTVMGRQCSNLWRTLIKNGHISEARLLVNAYYDPAQADEVVGRALLSMKEGLYPQAEEEYGKACKLRPNDMALRAHYARACYLNGNYKKAAELFKTLSIADPTNKRYALDGAIALIHCGKTEEAMPELFRLNYEYPDDLNVQRALAWGSLILHKVEQATKIYMKLVDIGKQNLNSINNTIATTAATDCLNAGYCAWVDHRVKTALVLFRESRMSEDALDKHFQADRELLESYGIGPIEQAMMLDALEKRDN